MFVPMLMAGGFAVFVWWAICYQPRRWVFTLAVVPVVFLILFLSLVIGGILSTIADERPDLGPVAQCVFILGIAACGMVWEWLGMRHAELLGPPVVSLRSYRARRAAAVWGFVLFVLLSLFGNKVLPEIDLDEYTADIARVLVIGVVLSTGVVAVMRLCKNAPRSPDVIFLRSFKTDRLYVRPTEAIAALCAAVGSFDAVSDPTDTDTSQFTLRSFHEGNTWREGVSTILRGAKLVVIDISVTTPGVSWELEQAMLPGRPGRSRCILIARADALLEEGMRADALYSHRQDPLFLEAFSELLIARFPMREAAIRKAVSPYVGVRDTSQPDGFI